MVKKTDEGENPNDNKASLVVKANQIEEYRSKRRILLNATTAYDGLYKKGRKRRSVRSLSDSDLGMLRFHRLYSILENEKWGDDTLYWPPPQSVAGSGRVVAIVSKKFGHQC